MIFFEHFKIFIIPSGCILTFSKWINFSLLNEVSLWLQRVLLIKTHVGLEMQFCGVYMNTRLDLFLASAL